MAKKVLTPHDKRKSDLAKRLRKRRDQALKRPTRKFKNQNAWDASKSIAYGAADTVTFVRMAGEGAANSWRTTADAAKAQAAKRRKQARAATDRAADSGFMQRLHGVDDAIGSKVKAAWNRVSGADWRSQNRDSKGRFGRGHK